MRNSKPVIQGMPSKSALRVIDAPEDVVEYEVIPCAVIECEWLTERRET
jgi:hypothetical protein